ncbi:MAG: hypothetical protein FJ125_00510 [Deltaproteobacteria bacterium]|nr:hypothetical protein [Deltaproteobacteria bacterium]
MRRARTTLAVVLACFCGMPGRPAAQQPERPFPVLLLQRDADAATTPDEELQELTAALARGLASSGPFQLLLPPPELQGQKPALCSRQDCLRGLLRRRAGFFLSFAIGEQDKDYSFHLVFTDAADPSWQRELYGNCDICSFDEACRALEELAAGSSLPRPIRRSGPWPPPWSHLAPATPVPAVVPPPPVLRQDGAAEQLAAAAPPAGADAPEIATEPAAFPAPAAPEPALAPVAHPAPSPASPLAAALPPPLLPAATGSPQQPAASDRLHWPPGWKLWGGSIGHSSRAVGWGMLGAGSVSLLLGLSSASGNDADGLDPGEKQRKATSTALFSALGVAAMATGVFFVLQGDRPPLGSAGPEDAAPPASQGARSAPGPAAGPAPSPLLAADREGLSLGLGGSF